MISLLERERPTTDQHSNAGIYADLKLYPDSVEYYAECPGCSHVQGGFKTLADARRNRLCNDCSLEQTEKIKKQIRQVIHEPEKKVKPLADIVKENEEPPVPLPPGNPEPAPEPTAPEDEEAALDAAVAADPWAAISQILFSSWVQEALYGLSQELDCNLDELEINDTNGDYDENAPDDTTNFVVDYGREQWWVFKDDDTARKIAVDRVAQDVRDEPDMFGADFLANYIDKEKLAQAVGDPYEDYGDEVNNMDYEEQLQKMVEEDEIESDDLVFFKKNGEPRVANKARVAQLNSIVDNWIEKTKPNVDPWEWLEDVYGRDARKQALELVDVDDRKVAEDVVSNDGWQNTLASYDHNSTDLPKGFVACRIN